MPPRADCLIVNAGDQLTHWTNGELRSANHRVVVADATQPRFIELQYDSSSPEEIPRGANMVLATCSVLAASLAPLAPSARRSHVEAAVLRVVRELTAASLTAEAPLMEAGVDSLAATELSSRLRALTGVALSPTMVFEQPTPRAIAVHLLEQASPLTASDVASRTALRAGDAGAARALVGARGQWPGASALRGARWRVHAACGASAASGTRTCRFPAGMPAACSSPTPKASPISAPRRTAT